MESQGKSTLEPITNQIQAKIITHPNAMDKLEKSEIKPIINGPPKNPPMA